ncbi:YybH family protein [Streptomyces sp. NPDC088915]|uniref:YybH family protein n=1 Tax=Streptomyces sp. NPDC088915 TaxID=3365912 RepID=UPI0037F55CA6
MSKMKHTLPLVAAALVLTTGSFIGPSFIQPEAVAASKPAATTTTPAPSHVIGARTAARTPAELLMILGERIKNKDVEGIIALHEPEAAVVNYDGSLVQGHAAIRAFYIEWFKSDPVLTVNPRQTVTAGGWRTWDGKTRDRTASIMGDYTLTQNAADGTRETFTGAFCDTVKEQWDGSWLYLQDNPYPPHGGPAPTAAHH